MPDKGAPFRHRAVDSFAIAKAASASISEKALNRSCTCSARASVACTTSSGVLSRAEPRREFSNTESAQLVRVSEKSFVHHYPYARHRLSASVRVA